MRACLFLLLVILATTESQIQLFKRRPLLRNIKRFNVPGPHPLFKNQHRDYFGFVSIGTPPRKFEMAFDTGSPYTWVPSAFCNQTLDTCKYRNKYNSSGSTTYIPNGFPFAVKVGFNGRVWGFLSTDYITMGEYEIKNTTFGEATYLSPDPFSFLEIDGILGLGLRYNTSYPEPPFSNLINQFQVNKYFCFFLNRDFWTHIGGEIIFGNTNPKYYTGNFRETPLVSTRLWMIQPKNIKLDKTTVCDNQCRVLVDSGTPSTYGPADQVNKINTALNATIIEGLPVVDCSAVARFPTVHIEFNSFILDWIPSYYVIKIYEEGVIECISGFVPQLEAAEYKWVFGDNFIGSYYTLFNVGNSTISFASLRGQNTVIATNTDFP